MRLWDWRLIPYLPKLQLLSQWRELNSIFKKQDKHILINYVYEYPKEDLLTYSLLVISEMNKRGYQTKSMENFNKYFDGTFLIDATRRYKNFVPFRNHHNRRYLIQCFYNLQEKYDRGQKDFSRELYEKLKAYMDEHARKGKRK